MANTPHADLAAFTNVTSLGTTPYVYTWTKGAGDTTFARPVRFLRAKQAGSIGVFMIDPADGVTKTVILDFGAGETRAVMALGVDDSDTTVTNVEAMA